MKNNFSNTILVLFPHDRGIILFSNSQVTIFQLLQSQSILNSAIYSTRLQEIGCLLYYVIHASNRGNDCYIRVSIQLLFNSNNNISYYFPSGSDGKESACNAGDLGGEYPLEEGMAINSRILAWKISWPEEPGRLQSMGSKRVSNTFTFINNKECGAHCYYFC